MRSPKVSFHFGNWPCFFFISHIEQQQKQQILKTKRKTKIHSNAKNEHVNAIRLVIKWVLRYWWKNWWIFSLFCSAASGILVRPNGIAICECESWHFHNLRLLLHWFHFDSAINTYFTLCVLLKACCWLYFFSLCGFQSFDWCAEHNLLIFRWVYISNKYTKEF